MKEILVYYCRYNIWANQKLATFFKDKPDDLLRQFVENSFPSIRETVLHILSAERSWLSRLQQDTSKNKRVLDDFGPTSEVFQQLVAVSEAFLAFIEAQDEQFFETQVSYQTWDGTGWNMQPKTMVHHCMNHSTYHRGQLITMARQLGFKENVPSTDILFFSREADA